MTPRDIEDLSLEERRNVLERSVSTEEVSGSVRGIIERVWSDGDSALLELTRKFDGVEVDSLEVSGDRIEEAYEAVPDEVVEAVSVSADRIREYHERQVQDGWETDNDVGMVGRRFVPVASAGVYVPGGGAAYPSTALMTVLPARIAGVDRVVACTPPPISNASLVALDTAGVDYVYRLGGAQAIAAMAYGTDTIDRVDAVVGPGNKYVTEAKKQVRDRVRIEFPAGPSEIGVVADGSADPGFVASDMVAQVEHDTDSRALLVTPNSELAADVAEEISELRGDADREEVREARIDILVGGMEGCVEFMREFAPEHLVIMARNDEEIMERVNNAGSVFLGSYTPVAAGDYATGTNHVLPTAGGARLYGGLSVDDFVRTQSVQRLTREGLRELEDTITTLARLEGLEMHARSVETRTRDSS